MRRIRSDKNLRLGMPKAPPRKYSRKIQATKLGDAPEGIPSFVFNIIGNLTWSYTFIRHMICVLLRAYFHFTCCLNTFGSEIFHNKSFDLKY